MLFPAQAGVILLDLVIQFLNFSFPRASGGDPGAPISWQDVFNFSPRKRG